MKKIYIGFSRPKGKICPCFSLAIRLHQGWTDYSHVYIKFKSDSLNREIIYQASGLQVNFIGSKLFYDHVHVIDEFEVTVSNGNYIKMMQFMVDNAGKPYSMADIFAILFNNEKLLDGNKKFICSEIASLILENFAGLPFDKPAGMLRPKDIYTYLVEIRDSIDCN